MKKLLFIIVTISATLVGYSQSKLWTKTTDENISGLEKFERVSNPSEFQLFSVNFSQLKSQLTNAPLDTSGMVSNVIVSFPDYTGKISDYVIYEAPVMEKALADKYPDIKSYVGKGVEDQSATVRFSTTVFGLHLMMTSGEVGTYYIDAYTKDLNNYLVYSRKNIKNNRTFSCLFENSPEEVSNVIDGSVQKATDGKFRQYRLAMACTIEYAAFHVNASPQVEVTDAEKKATVLAAMNVTMTRVNGIYEKDMSLRMNLVANNDIIIFINSDSFDNNNTNNILLTQSQSVIDGDIGSANYDIGHTVSTGGGGVATLNSPCNNSTKARGITGLPSPVGDPFDVDYVAHEMGHQWGGPHTFSGNGGSCTGNGSAANAVEPGSGSTIMAYAGICTANVQSNSDPYFHAVSIASMNAFMISTSCGTSVNNNNNVPVISPLINYTIPKGTAFVLTGSATDVNAGAALTYCWEQTNAASGVDAPTTTQTTGPIYRSFNPSTSNKRYFPRFSDVLNGNLTPTWEVTPDIGRTLNFALTVRDNQTPTGGQTARANMTVTTVNGAGPFAITFPNVENTSWTPGSSQTITWNVAGTTANGINTSNVNILFSSDNGVTFSTLLANTANDGTQSVTLPNISAPYCRIIIEAVGNIYYAVTKNFSLGYQVSTVCTNYTRTFANQAIPTNWTAYNLPLAPGITDSYTISDANVAVVSTAARTNQVSFGLVKPGSGVVDFILFDGPTSGCNNGVSDLNAVFDDEGANFSCGNTNSGQSYKPVTSLTGVDGLNSAGQWRFAAKSSDAGNTFSSVTLTLCRVEATLTTPEFGFENFSIYPNPNKGDFAIRFTSSSSNEIKVNIHDLRGRLVFTQNFQNTGIFNENVQLDNTQKGVYLITVLDGEKKVVKKIIID